MDTRTVEQRSRIMQSVRSKNTKPEIAVRQIIWRMGFRYSLHSKDLPGRPDIVFRKKHRAIFVHGCFWHGHDCTKGKLPKSHQDFWEPKIAANRARDAKAVTALTSQGWGVLVVWQCELAHVEEVKARLLEFLR